MMAEGQDKKALAPIQGAAAAIDEATGGAIKELVADNEFKGAASSSSTVRLPGTFVCVGVYVGVLVRVNLWQTTNSKSPLPLRPPCACQVYMYVCVPVRVCVFLCVRACAYADMRARLLVLVSLCISVSLSLCLKEENRRCRGF